MSDTDFNPQPDPPGVIGTDGALVPESTGAGEAQSDLNPQPDPPGKASSGEAERDGAIIHD